MPCTFSHPFAVIPLHRFCPTRLNFAALVIGSMSPDFAYYLRQFPVPAQAHTIAGTVTVCLGLAAIVALSIAVPAAFRMAALFEGYAAFRVFVFRTGVYAAAAFIPLIALTSIILYAVRRKRA